MVKMLKLFKKKIDAIKPEPWAAYVKTGMHKERPPIREDWWYIRAASILRKMIRYGPIGVSKLRVYYGGKKDRGVKPERFYNGSGNIIRKILQQLEKADLVKSVKEGKKGRIVTKKGKEFLNAVASKISIIPKYEIKKKKEDGTAEMQKEEEKPKEGKEEDHIKKLVEKTKEFAKGKKITADDMLKEA